MAYYYVVFHPFVDFHTLTCFTIYFNDDQPSLCSWSLSFNPFQKVFEMHREEFKGLVKWKQVVLKQRKKLYWYLISMINSDPRNCQIVFYILILVAGLLHLIQKLCLNSITIFIEVIRNILCDYSYLNLIFTIFRQT